MSRENEIVDSEIEQQLSEDEGLFNAMAAGAVEEEELVVEEDTPVVEEVEDEQLEVEEDDPTNEQVEDVVDVEDTEQEDTPTDKSIEQLYTSEEIKGLLTTGDFTRIDTSRLSEEGKLVMKSMQAGLTPKLQEAAELRQQMKDLTATVKEALPKPQPKDIFEAYDQDSAGVMAFVNNKISELIAAGQKDSVEFSQIEETRNQLYRHQDTRPVEQSAPVVADPNATTANMLLKAIPTIDTKQLALKDYAIDVMGYTPEELEAATNLTSGASAVREIVRINNAYDKHMAPREAAAKQKQKKALKVEKSGGGFSKNETTTKDLITSAQKSGDWMDVFLALEE
jgi:hypothetical protein